MLKPPLPLTVLSEAQRAQAQERFEIIHPALEEGVTQAQVARTHKISASTLQSWIKRYRDKGFAGLAIERLMMQVDHVLVANQTQIVTKDVVETAQQNLIIGPG